MHMAEDEIIGAFGTGIFAGIFDERVGNMVAHLAYQMAFAGLAAPPLPETHRPVGMHEP